jgi:hypothetical protein
MNEQQRQSVYRGNMGWFTRLTKKLLGDELGTTVGKAVTGGTRMAGSAVLCETLGIACPNEAESGDTYITYTAPGPLDKAATWVKDNPLPALAIGAGAWYLWDNR